jgi:hypothetical protein
LVIRAFVSITPFPWFILLPFPLMILQELVDEGRKSCPFAIFTSFTPAAGLHINRQLGDGS